MFDVEAAGPATPETTNTITRKGWVHGTSENDHITPLSTNVRVFGHGGDDLFTLTGWNTTAKGGSGDDTMIFEGSRHYGWGNSGADTFVVATGDTRIDIMDFDAAEDSLYFANGVGGMASFDDIEASMYQAGSTVRIDMDGGTVTLRNVDIAELGAGSLHTYAEARDVPDTLTPPDTAGPTITGRGWLNGTAENDMIVSGGGNVRLSGGFGDDHMIGEHWAVRMQGGAGDDLLEARAHHTTLRGDAGADTFLFRGRVDGKIQDFNTVEDRLAFDIEGTGFESYDDIVDAFVEGTRGVEIVSENGDSLTLEGVRQDMLAEDMFLFV